MYNENPIWGFDSDGDLALRIGDKIYSFYKWSNPTILTDKESINEFKPLNDSNSKTVWREVRDFCNHKIEIDDEVNNG
jgi:hypothetical protein